MSVGELIDNNKKKRSFKRVSHIERFLFFPHLNEANHGKLSRFLTWAKVVLASGGVTGLLQLNRHTRMNVFLFRKKRVKTQECESRDRGLKVGRLKRRNVSQVDRLTLL